MNSEPIFIVGVQRSGTTLLAAMLAAHSRMSCGPETHFFRRLADVDPGQLCRPDEWPRRAVDFLAGIRHSAYEGCEGRSLLEKYALDRSQVTAFLESREPSVPSILAAVTETCMKRRGKRRWMEKTPDHLEHLAALRKSFPKSPVVRIVRDPRDVALSLTEVPWGTKSVLEGLLFWRERDESSEAFFRTDPRAFSLRFEDLVASPEAELRKLCEFVGETYEPGMLDTSSAGRQVNSRNAPWKAKASHALDPGRIAVWKRVLTPDDNRLAEAVLGDRLDRYGYPRAEDFPRLGEIYPDFRVGLKFASALSPVADSGVRFWKVSDEEKATVRVFVGEPDACHWFAPGRAGKALSTLRLSAKILKTRLRGQSLFWIPDADSKGRGGHCSTWLQRLLTPYKVNLSAVSPAHSEMRKA